MSRLPSGSLRVRVYAGIHPVTGRQRYLSRTVPDGPTALAAAEAAARRLVDQVRDRRRLRTDVTVTELLDRHVDLVHATDATRRSYRHTVTKHLQPRLGHLKLAAVTPEVLDYLYAALHRCRDRCAAYRGGRQDGRPLEDGHRCRPLQPGTIRIGDPQVRRGMSGRGHTLQIFGHYDAALRCFTQAARHAAHFPGTTEDQQHDAYAQIVYTETLRHGRRPVAEAAVRRMHAYAERHGDHIEIQFTRWRRVLEMRLGFATERERLVVAAHNRRQETTNENDFRRFLELAGKHPSPNRLLAAQDITLLYAVLTRDAALARTARDTFQHITDHDGAYANLTDRFNNRLNTAAWLSKKFRDIPPVTGPRDPLRHTTATPAHPSGLLVTPHVAT